MSFELSIINSDPLLLCQTAGELLHCNERLLSFGLELSPEQAAALALARAEALQGAGRIELDSGALKRLLLTFCDSPYITAQNLEENVSELLEAFYYYKNETRERISDDELIAYMKACFDGPCQGSVELMASRELKALADRLKSSFAESEGSDE